MLAGRNVGLFVGVLTMGGKRSRRNEKEGKRKVRGKMGEKAGERERERENEPTSFPSLAFSAKIGLFVSIIGRVLPCLLCSSVPSGASPQIGYRLSSLDFFRDAEIKAF